MTTGSYFGLSRMRKRGKMTAPLSTFLNTGYGEENDICLPAARLAPRRRGP
jgi:hypothetical protein